MIQIFKSSQTNDIDFNICYKNMKRQITLSNLYTKTKSIKTSKHNKNLKKK